MTSSNAPILKICPLEHFRDLSLPKFQTDGAVGMDVQACLTQFEKQQVAIYPGKRVKIPTGLAVQVPEGYELQVRPRSGISLKTDLLMVNSPGTIDTDFTGETHVILGNFGKYLIKIYHGDRIAQWVVAPVVKPTLQVISYDELPKTKRGSNGFGSTGVQ